jgi:hypothetical protein
MEYGPMKLLYLMSELHWLSKSRKSGIAAKIKAEKDMSICSYLCDKLSLLIAISHFLSYIMNDDDEEVVLISKSKDENVSSRSSYLYRIIGIAVPLVLVGTGLLIIFLLAWSHMPAVPSIKLSQTDVYFHSTDSMLNAAMNIKMQGVVTGLAYPWSLRVSGIKCEIGFNQKRASVYDPSTTYLTSLSISDAEVGWSSTDGDDFAISIQAFDTNYEGLRDVLKTMYMGLDSPNKYVNGYCKATIDINMFSKSSYIHYAFPYEYDFNYDIDSTKRSDHTQAIMRRLPSAKVQSTQVQLLTSIVKSLLSNTTAIPVVQSIGVPISYQKTLFDTFGSLRLHFPELRLKITPNRWSKAIELVADSKKLQKYSTSSWEIALQAFDISSDDFKFLTQVDISCQGSSESSKASGVCMLIDPVADIISSLIQANTTTIDFDFLDRNFVDNLLGNHHKLAIASSSGASAIEILESDLMAPVVASTGHIDTSDITGASCVTATGDGVYTSSTCGYISPDFFTFYAVVVNGNYDFLASLGTVLEWKFDQNWALYHSLIANVTG